jgi:hypothetical protein
MQIFVGPNDSIQREYCNNYNIKMDLQEIW